MEQSASWKLERAALSLTILRRALMPLVEARESPAPERKRVSEVKARHPGGAMPCRTEGNKVKKKKDQKKGTVQLERFQIIDNAPEGN